MWNFVLIFSVLYLNLNFRFRFNIFFKWEITWSRKKYKTEAYTYKVNPHFLILTIMSFDRPKWLKFASSHFLPSIRNQSTTTTKYVIICLPQPVYYYFLYFQSTKKTLNSRQVPSVFEFEKTDVVTKHELPNANQYYPMHDGSFVWQSFILVL